MVLQKIEKWFLLTDMWEKNQIQDVNSFHLPMKEEETKSYYA
jgi:hypothetical protein